MTRRSKVEEAVPPSPPSAPRVLHSRVGWTMLFVAMAFGSALEGFIGFRSELFASDPLRRELWSLAHFHAAMLGIVNLVYGDAGGEGVTMSRLLVTGGLLIPLGFLLGGLSHPEGDPGIGIFLVPLGSLLVLVAIGARMLSVWRR